MKLQRVLSPLPKLEQTSKQTCLRKQTKIFCLSTPIFCFISTTTFIGLALLNNLMKSTEQLKLEGTSGGCLPQPPAQGMSTTASCSGLCPAGFWVIAKDGESTTFFGPPVPAIYHPYHKKNPLFSWCLNGISCITICAISGNYWEQPGSILFIPPH